MRYFVSFSHSSPSGGLGFGNVIITNYSMNTTDDMHKVVKNIEDRAMCRNVVILNFIKLEDEE